jgi:hypothetical protein
MVFTPARKERFKIRTSGERANAHLKDWLLPAQIFVHGVEKVSFQLLCGALCLAALKILQYFICQERRSSLHLSPSKYLDKMYML